MSGNGSEFNFGITPTQNAPTPAPVSAISTASSGTGGSAPGFNFSTAGLAFDGTGGTAPHFSSGTMETASGGMAVDGTATGGPALALNFSTAPAPGAAAATSIPGFGAR